jgi:type II secretory pathway pseudopilin PulG
MKNNLIKGQVWIETVLYTLIGLALIGIALAFIMPKINEIKDRSLVEQAINSIGALDEKVTEVIQRGAGNVRESEFSMKTGELYINSSGNEIMFVLNNLGKPYSQPGVEIAQGRISLVTIAGQKTNSVYLRVRYRANITYAGKEETKKFTAASTPYNFFIENKGLVNNNDSIDITESSNR